MRRRAVWKIIGALIVIALVLFFVVKTSHSNNCPASYPSCGAGYVPAHVDDPADDGAGHVAP
jgi:hypothetical protein